MEGSKQMLEAKLQDAGLQLMECERQLSEALCGPHGPNALAAAGAAAGTPPSSTPRRQTGHQFFNSLLGDEVAPRVVRVLGMYNLSLNGRGTSASTASWETRWALGLLGFWGCITCP